MASQCGMPEFREKYATVESLVHLWEENIPFTLVPITDLPNPTENKVSTVKLCVEIINYYTCLQCMPETADQSLPDSDPNPSSVLNKEASQGQQNLQTTVSDIASTCVEPQPKKKKRADYASQGSTD